MKIGWLADPAAYKGGAEHTQAEFRAAAPADIEVVDCAPGEIEDCDRYVVHNCVLYSLDDLKALEGKPVTKYWHDVGPWLKEPVMDWLRENATHICCSPIQAEHMDRGEGRPDSPDRLLNAFLIPPPIDLGRFEEAAAASNGHREGAVCVGSWRNLGKAPHKALEWAHGNGGVDFYGSGPFAPADSREIAYEGMPALLAKYETFVFLPTVIEPFGRVVAEAWAAGCALVVNGLVGATYWIQEAPEKIESAASDFWRLVLDV